MEIMEINWSLKLSKDSKYFVSEATSKKDINEGYVRQFVKWIPARCSCYGNLLTQKGKCFTYLMTSRWKAAWNLTSLCCEFIIARGFWRRCSLKTKIIKRIKVSVANKKPLEMCRINRLQLYSQQKLPLNRESFKFSRITILNLRPCHIETIYIIHLLTRINKYINK